MPSPLVRRTRALAVSAVVAALLVLVGCAGEPGASPSAGAPADTTSPTPSPSSSRSSASPDPSPSGTSKTVTMPTDCRAILTAAVLAELGTTPLNDPAFGSSGVQPDGSLICVWGDPGADTTNLVTTISKLSRGPALDLLNGLASTEGFTCYTPDGGTRCEKTWQNENYPVTDGRTLFWRDDVLVDTRFSNLAPSGYTAAIVASVFG